MIDIKQLQYFMVCTDVGSFSKAAKILYTTQSNVSKAIKALEKEVGASLFVRESRGILLTAKGRHVYQYASRILEEVGALSDFSASGMGDSLNICANPSSWFSNRFVEFYNLYEQEKFHCQIYTTSTKNMMKRIRDYLDDLGFLYIAGSERDEFQYQLMKNRLEFIPLAEVETILYLGEKNQEHGKSELSEESIKNLRFIQRYQDGYADSEEELWFETKYGKCVLPKPDVAVITNSDYIMEKMLKDSALANISGNYLTKDGRDTFQEGVSLQREEQVVFGCLKREGEMLEGISKVFLEFIKQSFEG